jgi:hypothetical protein
MKLFTITNKNMERLSLVEWMTKHNVSTQQTNLNLAIARALDSLDLQTKHDHQLIIKL